MSELPKIKVSQSRPQLRSTQNPPPSTRYNVRREKNWDGRFYVEKMKEFRDGERLSLYQKLKL